MSDYIAATTHVDTVSHELLFDSEGYYVVGDGQWQDITFTTTLTYNGGNIGIAPRVYATNMYMFLSIYNETNVDTGVTQAFANLNVQSTYDTFHLDNKQLDPLVAGQDYTFVTTITGTNYRISLNDIVIFNVEYPAMVKGSVGVYSTAGNACKSIQVDSAFADGWVSNVSSIPGAIVDIRETENDDRHAYIFSPNASTAYIAQVRDVTAGGTYTLSFNYMGIGTARIAEDNGTELKQYDLALPQADDWAYETLTATVSPDCTKVSVFFLASNGAVMANTVQFEEKGFATGYIYNDSLTDPAVRESSIITYPSKDNINAEQGSLAMWFSPEIDYNASTSENIILFEYGDTQPLLLYYSPSGSLRFKCGNYDSIGITMDLAKDTWYNAVATWSTNGIQLWVGTDKVSASGIFDTLEGSNVIRIGWSGNASYSMFNGIIDETVVYSSVLSDDEATSLATSTDPIADNDSVILHASFNHAIANFNHSIIEATLAPLYGSPVIVTKQDGTSMRKVSFFDIFTGEYRTFNQEPVVYDKAYDYLPISYDESLVDQDAFKISVVDGDDVSWGDPITLDGKKVMLTLTDDQKNSLDGTTLIVSYQLNDSFTVDFNIGVPDSFRVTLGKYDGNPVTVTYEGNRFTDQKLADMVELNPMLNPNHEGFLYVTQNVEKVSSFRVRATPDNLPANGGTESLIIVEPLDSNGNYISHCKLLVSCELGTILPTYDADSIKLRDRAGRFLYQYRPPIIQMSDVNAAEVIDYINVIDNETGIGVQVQMTLKTLENMNYTILQGDTIQKIAAQYGSTVQDIAYTDDIVAKVNAKYGANTESADSSDDVHVANATKYITDSVGETIVIPISYSSRQLQKSQVDIRYDHMIAYLMDFIMDYMNKPASSLPSGLGALLDFNADGMINIDEITWLQDNRLTTTLLNQYNEVLAWDQAN